MNLSIAHSSDLGTCIAQLQASAAPAPRLVIFFASPQCPIADVGDGFREAFPSAKVIGCSTAGELSSRGMTKGAIAAMALPPELAPQAAAVIIRDLQDPGSVAAALEEIGRQLRRPVSDLDPGEYVGLIFVDGLSGAEEELMERLGDLTDLPIIGGSAGDDLAFQKTHVSLDGAVYESAAVLAVLHLPGGYRIVKTQSFQGTGKVLTATDVDEGARTVTAFDGEKANVAYARTLGVTPAELPGHFLRHPLGLMVDGEPFVRSPQKVTDNGEIVFYCRIRRGMELEILESTDIVSATADALGGVNGGVAAILNFNCILRTMELEAKGQCGDYGRLFSAIPTIGFSTYGEELMGHMNQTATMLLLSQPPRRGSKPADRN
jgi:hypothetical protein